VPLLCVEQAQLAYTDSNWVWIVLGRDTEEREGRVDLLSGAFG